MPELGKATYELVFNTAQADAAIEDADARYTAATDNISRQMGMVEKSAAGAGEQLTLFADDASAASAEASAAMDRTGVAAEEMGAAVSAGAGTAAKASEAAAAKTTTAWGAAASRISSIGKKMRGFGRTMTHKITLPVAVIGGVGAKMFLDYSQKIKLLQTQAGATVGEMNHMNKAIMAMASSGSTIHGPEQLADAMYHIESAGLRGAKALDTLKVASNGAMVGNAGLEETTYALVSAVETHAKGTETLGKAMGNVNAIIGAGDMRLGDLTGALSTGIIPAAKSAGLGLRDIGAALDTMTSRGMPAQISATRLGMTIAMMQKPTKAAADALGSVGIKSLDLARIMRARGLPAALGYLRDKLLKIKDPAKRAQVVLQAFGGGRSGKAMLLLLQNLDDVKQRYATISANAKKFAKSVEAAKAEPINKLKTAWAQLQTTLIRIGAQVVPYLVKFAKELAHIGDWFSKLSPRWQKFILIGVGALAVLGPVISLVGMLATAVGGLAVAFEFLLANPIVLAIVAVGAAFVLLYVKVKAFRNAVNAVVGWVVNHWRLIAMAILWTTMPLVALYIKFKWFRSVVNGVFNSIKNHWKAIITIMLVVAAPFLGLAIEVIRHWQGVWTWLKQFANDLVLLFSHPLNAIGKMWHDLVVGIKGAFVGIWNDIKSTVASVVNLMVRAVNSLISLINSIPVPTITVKYRQIPVPVPHGAGWKGGVLGHPTAPGISIKHIPFPYPSFGLTTLGAIHHIGSVGNVSFGGGGGGGTASSTPPIEPGEGAMGGGGGGPSPSTGKKKKQASLFPPGYGGTPGLGEDGGIGGKKKKKKSAAQRSREAAMFGPKWNDLELRLANAERTKGLGDDLKALRAEESYLEKLRKQRGLSKVRQLAIAKKLVSLDKEIAAIAKKMNKERERLLGLAERRKEAKLQKREQALEDSLTIAQAKAELAGGHLSEAKRKAIEEKKRKIQLRILAIRENYLKQRIKLAKGDLHKQAQLYKELLAVHRKRLALAKRANADEASISGAEAQAVMDLRGSFFSEFAGNIFGTSSGGLTLQADSGGGDKNVTVNQSNQYNEIPKNRHRHGREMQRAAGAAMDGV